MTRLHRNAVNLLNVRGSEAHLVFTEEARYRLWQREHARGRTHYLLTYGESVRLRHLREKRKAEDEQARNSSVRRCDDGSVDVLGYLLAARQVIRPADQAIITQAVEAINQTLNRQEEQETQMKNIDEKLEEALEAQRHLTNVIEQLETEKRELERQTRQSLLQTRVTKMRELVRKYRTQTPFPFMHVSERSSGTKIRLNLAKTRRQEDHQTGCSSVTMGQPSFDTIEALLLALEKADRQ